MDRTWLIRTAQNQILGPVAKQKLLEFIQKGALGLLDEVSSGNGYWFSLNEKDLVEKYLHGDLPQGYNPISESRSILSKKDNPNKTTSINSAPANQVSPAINSNSNTTQVIKLDLESFNDSSEKIVVHNPIKNAISTGAETTKLPTQDDLEFPDVDLIASSVNVSFENGDLALSSSLTSVKIPMPIPKSSYALKSEPTISEEDIILPDEDDLAFPDMDDAKTSPKIAKGKVDLSHQYTRTVALDIQQTAAVLPQELEIEVPTDPLSFEVAPVGKPFTAVEEKVVTDFDHALIGNNTIKDNTSSLKIDRINVKAAGNGVITEEKKLLHDRPTKSSVTKGAALRDPNRENHSKEVQTVPQKRNDNYLFFILIILVLIMLAIFFYFKEILNKPLPM